MSRILNDQLGAFDDAFARAGLGFGYTFPAKRPWMRIDRVLTNGKLVALGSSIWTAPATDHRGISAVLARRSDSAVGRAAPFRGQAFDDTGVRRPIGRELVAMNRGVLAWVVTALLAATPAFAQSGDNVLLVVNETSADGGRIAAHYARLRAVPLEPGAAHQRGRR